MAKPKNLQGALSGFLFAQVARAPFCLMHKKIVSLCSTIFKEQIFVFVLTLKLEKAII